MLARNTWIGRPLKLLSHRRLITIASLSPSAAVPAASPASARSALKKVWDCSDSLSYHRSSCSSFPSSLPSLLYRRRASAAVFGASCLIFPPPLLPLLPPALPPPPPCRRQRGEDGSKYFRLPRNVLPSHYDILILSDLEALTFSGLVAIDVDVHEDTDKLILNVGNKLGLGKAIVASEALKTESKSVLSLDVDTKHERATAKLASKLPKGSKATITCAFEGVLDDSMMGYYRSSWEHEGKSGYYGLTQFEPTAARRAFPALTNLR
ncbi:hypothetical protein L7F22_064296 [Adiantum nelumboides]|nr:hypothetical protein [Adiantum nelumboides]